MLVALFPHKRSLFKGLLLGLCCCLPASVEAAQDAESGAVAETGVLRSLNLKFSGSALIRGQYQRTEMGLKLLLPMPGKDRPKQMASPENSGIRLMNLIPVAGQTDVAEGLLGRWRVVSGVLDGKETDLFNGDEIMFDVAAVRIVEKNNGSDYVGTYHVPSSDREMQANLNDRENHVQTLRKKYQAVVDESSEGKVTGISIHGLQNSQASAWPDELGDLLSQVTSLESLTLTDYEFSDASQQLRFLTKLIRLESLDLRKTNVSDAALAHVAQLSTLRILKLEYSDQLTDKGLTATVGLSQLSELDLAFVPVTDLSFESLAQLKSLKKLYLYGTLISDQGLQRLPELSELEVLYVGRDEGADISDASIEILAARQSLRTLGIPGTRFSPEGLQKLREQMPNCSLVGAETVQELSMASDANVPISTGTANSVVTMNEQSVELKHCLAYPTKGKPTDPVTILVTSEPVRLSDLETAISTYGDDYTFAPFVDQVRIRLRADKTVESIHVVVDGKTVNDAGPHVVATTTIKNNEIEGTASIKGSAKARHLTYSVKLQFSTVIQTPEVKAAVE